MFRRRQPLSLVQKLRHSVWPKSGWARAWRFILARVGRLPGSAYAIAGGFAWGAALSFTPLMGLHFALSMLLAWITRCSILAAAIGTVVGNPWTFPFIWLWLYKMGVAMGFGSTGVEAESVDFAGVFGNVFQAALSADWRYVLETAMPVLSPMLAASVPTAIIVWITFYLLLRPVVERYKGAATVRAQRRALATTERLAREEGGS